MPFAQLHLTFHLSCPAQAPLLSHVFQGQCWFSFTCLSSQDFPPLGSLHGLFPRFFLHMDSTWSITWCVTWFVPSAPFCDVSCYMSCSQCQFCDVSCYISFSQCQFCDVSCYMSCSQCQFGLTRIEYTVPTNIYLHIYVYMIFIYIYIYIVYIYIFMYNIYIYMYNIYIYI